MSAIFGNIRAESYPSMSCGVDQAVLDSKDHGGLPLGRVDLVLKFKEHFRWFILIANYDWSQLNVMRCTFRQCVNAC